MFKMTIFTDEYKFVGLHRIKVDAIDQISGVQAFEPLEFAIEVYDECYSGQSLSLDLPEKVFDYNLL